MSLWVFFQTWLRYFHLLCCRRKSYHCLMPSFCLIRITFSYYTTIFFLSHVNQIISIHWISFSRMINRMIYIRLIRISFSWAIRHYLWYSWIFCHLCLGSLIHTWIHDLTYIYVNKTKAYYLRKKCASYYQLVESIWALHNQMRTLTPIWLWSYLLQLLLPK